MQRSELMTLLIQKRPIHPRQRPLHPIKQKPSISTFTANEAVVIMTITMEEETTMVETVAAIMAVIVEARNRATLVAILVAVKGWF